MDILTVCQLCVGKGGVDGYTDCMQVMLGEGECRWIY